MELCFSSFRTKCENFFTWNKRIFSGRNIVWFGCWGAPICLEGSTQKLSNQRADRAHDPLPLTAEFPLLAYSVGLGPLNTVSARCLMVSRHALSALEKTVGEKLRFLVPTNLLNKLLQLVGFASTRLLQYQTSAPGHSQLRPTLPLRQFRIRAPPVKHCHRNSFPQHPVR